MGDTTIWTVANPQHAADSLILLLNDTVAGRISGDSGSVVHVATTPGVRQ